MCRFGVNRWIKGYIKVGMLGSHRGPRAVNSIMSSKSGARDERLTRESSSVLWGLSCFGLGGLGLDQA